MTPVRMQKIEDAMRTGLSFWNSLKAKHYEEALAWYHEDIQLEPAEYSGLEIIIGIESVTEYWMSYHRSNPDMEFETEDAWGLGDRFVLRWSSEDGKRGAEILRIRDSKIIQHLSYRKDTVYNQCGE